MAVCYYHMYKSNIVICCLKQTKEYNMSSKYEGKSVNRSQMEVKQL
jgi:hypothetical protein